MGATGPPVPAASASMNADAQLAAPRSNIGRFADWAQRVRLERKLVIALLVGAVTAGIATFAAMTESLPAAVDTWVILLLLLLDLALLLCLGALIARRLVILHFAAKSGVAGARLHARLVALFSLVAVTPTIIVATFSVLFFDFGLQGWFSQRVRTAVEESVAVAQAYLEEHLRTINADALAMAQDLNREGPLLLFNPQRFNQFLAAQAGVRSLTEAMVFDRSGHTLARAGFGLLLDFDPRIPDWALRRAQQGEVVILTANTEDRVQALLRLEAFNDAYLIVGRLVDPRVLAHMDRTRGAAQLYEELEGRRAGVEITFALIFVVVALLLLLTAVWVGLAFANYLTRPIGKLIAATEKVRTGDLSARVQEDEASDEIGALSRAFNRMTGELQRQQQELLEANRQLDSRRRFIEAVLSGVSAGVIGLDREGNIELPNRSAGELLSADADLLYGNRLEEILPDVAPLIEEARQRPGRVAQGQLSVELEAGHSRTILARVVAEPSAEGVFGFVVTFDDITDLLSAQRKAAWADVARRIAHEIKNPLTPIQLSAERIKRKYRGQIQTDPETFEICTDTIVRHVGDIGRMVDEFSSFARMPAPSMAEENICRLVNEAVFLQKTAQAGIRFSSDLPDEPIIVSCDGQQVMRAITNILKNAVEAIEGRKAANGQTLPPGEIRVRVAKRAAALAIEVEDNGRGLPKGERQRLTEPYVTTRSKGTGLGLAIVRKIMEDHGGDLILEDRPEGGAKIALVFPLRDDSVKKAASQEQETDQEKATAHGT